VAGIKHLAKRGNPVLPERPPCCIYHGEILSAGSTAKAVLATANPVNHLPDNVCPMRRQLRFPSYEDIRADVEKAEEYWQLANEARGPVLKAEYDKMARKIMDQIRPALS
jgi:hypothetical protein